MLLPNCRLVVCMQTQLGAFQPGLTGGKGEQGLAAGTGCWGGHPCWSRRGGWIGDTGLGFLGALMGTPAIFHSCAFFPPFPKLGSKCTNRKTDLGAGSHARCRKQVHVAVPALPSVLPHYPALRAVPPAPAPTRARAWRGWLRASSHPFFRRHLLPLHHTNHHPEEFAARRQGCPHLFLPTPSLCASVYRPAGQREARAAAAGGRTGAVPPH